MRRRVSFQKFESRYALAGDVTAAVIDGDLILTGDAAANEIHLQFNSSGGLAVTGNAGTTVNGSGTFPVTFASFAGDINLQLYDGDDGVSIGRATNSQDHYANIFANLGSGSDTFEMAGHISGGTPILTLPVAGSIIVTGRDGNDTLQLDRIAVGGDVIFDGGDGDDTVSIFDATAVGTTVTGQIIAEMSTGDDTVTIEKISAHRVTIRDPMGTTAGSQVTLDTLHIVAEIELYLSIHADNVNIFGVTGPSNAGAFTATHLILHTGNGDDLIHIENVHLSDATIFTGEGNEGGGFFGVQLVDVGLANMLLIDTAGGLDNVLLDRVNAFTVDINTWAGSDGVILQDVDATSVRILTLDDPDVVGIHGSNSTIVRLVLGDGDDWLVLSDNVVAGTADFSGGPGNNQYSDLGGNAFPNLVRTLI